MTISRDATLTSGVWNSPNLHGDITYAAYASGVENRFAHFGPFGQPIVLTTMVIGSTTGINPFPDATRQLRPWLSRFEGQVLRICRRIRNNRNGRTAVFLLRVLEVPAHGG